MSSNQFKLAVVGLITVAGFVIQGPARADQDSASWFLTQIQLTDGYTPTSQEPTSPDKAVAAKEESSNRPQDKVAATPTAK